MMQENFTIDELSDLIKDWLITGHFYAPILSNNFQFTSPFWKRANKEEFLVQFGDPQQYQSVALSKITHFDPVIQLKDSSAKNFAIILQYHTRNGHHVYETVLGSVENGLVVELRSIYDLEETQKALEIMP